jgi:predicted O-methyltransferase YrrM
MIQRYVKKYLKPKGWLQSTELHESVNNEGPIPWYTYPFLKFLTTLVKPHHKVFEYGAGNSSLWLANHVSEVVTVEHDPIWYEHIQKKCNYKIELIQMDSQKNSKHYSVLNDFDLFGLKPHLTPDNKINFKTGIIIEPFKSYAAEILNYKIKTFDIIIIDGMARVLTTWLAIERIKKEGFIIFDNTDRDGYEDAFMLLKKNGYHRIDFWGTGPINPYEWCTSVFTKNIDILP